MEPLAERPMATLPDRIAAALGTGSPPPVPHVRGGVPGLASRVEKLEARAGAPEPPPGLSLRVELLEARIGTDLQCLRDDVLTSLDGRLSKMDGSISEALGAMGVDLRRFGRRVDEVDARLHEAQLQLREELEQQTRALAERAEQLRGVVHQVVVQQREGHAHLTGLEAAHDGHCAAVGGRLDPLSSEVPSELTESLRGAVQQVVVRQRESLADLLGLRAAHDGHCAAVGGRLDRLSSEVAELRAAAAAPPMAPEGYQELRQQMQEFGRAHKELGRGLLAELGRVDESGDVKPAPDRRGRKAAGFVTKRQLIAALSQDEDSEEEHGGEARQQGARCDPREAAAAAAAAARAAPASFPGLATLASQLGPGAGAGSQASPLQEFLPTLGAGSQASPLHEFLPTPGISTPGSAPGRAAGTASSAGPWVWREPFPPPRLADQLAGGG